MNTMRRGVLLAAIAGSLLVGGVVGATSFGASPGSAAKSTSTTRVAAPRPVPDAVSSAPSLIVWSSRPSPEDGLEPHLRSAR